MSPASYLTAPPRGAREGYQTPGYDPSVPWWTWIALGFFLVTLVATAVVAFVGARRVQRAQASAEAMTAAFEDLARKVEELEQRAAVVEKRRARVEEHVARLGRSRERLSVLTWALRDATRELTSLRSVLRK
jgi:cell division protein FtsB